MAFLAVFLQSYGSSYTDQIRHVDEVSRTLMMAEAVFTTVLGRIREAPFVQRFFRGKPCEELDRKLLNGSYDLFVADAPPEFTDQVDIFVRCRYGRVTKLYFWRVKNEETIFDSGGRVFSIIFSTLDDAKFPTMSGNPFLPEIKDLINRRKENEPKGGLKVQALGPVQSLQKILDTLHATPPGTPPIKDVPATTTAPANPPLQPPIQTVTPVTEQSFLTVCGEKIRQHLAKTLAALISMGVTPTPDYILDMYIAGVSEGKEGAPESIEAAISELTNGDPKKRQTLVEVLDSQDLAAKVGDQIEIETQKLIPFPIPIPQDKLGRLSQLIVDKTKEKAQQ